VRESAPPRSKLIAAFAAVYIIWGSTYLAIRFVLETMPPFSTAGVRFIISGAILYLWTRSRGEAAPTALHWRNTAIVGACLLLGGNGGVMWAEQYVPSGIAALLVAILPFWMVLLDWIRGGGRRPPGLVFAGLGLGLVGLGLLIGPDALRGGGDIDLLGAGVLILGSLSWAVGSVYTQRAPRPSSPSNGSGAQMFGGGMCLLAAGLVGGEAAQLDLARASTRSWLGFLYLVTFGSLIGFTAYAYLLAHTTAAKAATYAYVNPVVAVLLGWAFANEPVTSRTAPSRNGETAPIE